MTTRTSCLQEVHGKDDFLQANQVLAPRFLFFGTFIPNNENAGGSAICIHKELLFEDAVVTHDFCPGRDHTVSIQSGRKILVIVHVDFEPELALRGSRVFLRVDLKMADGSNAARRTTYRSLSLVYLQNLQAQQHLHLQHHYRRRCVTFTATPMSLRTWGTGLFQVTSRLYVLSFKNRLIGDTRANVFHVG